MAVTLLPVPACKVYTPPSLAKAMILAIGDSRRRWLEPSCGTGVFLTAIRETFGPKSLIVGIDLDTKPSAADDLGDVTRGVDFLTWSRGDRRRFDCVVGNPPFVAIRSLSTQLREDAAAVLDLSGNRIGVCANTWYAFLLQSFRMLKKGGHMAFILPSASEYADYSKRGRALLTSQFDRVDLIRSQRPLFDSVQEGTVILVCRGKSGAAGRFRRHAVSGLKEAVARLHDLDGIKARHCPQPNKRPNQKLITLSEIMDIRLGGVTGDCQYFVFSESRRKELGLPKSSVIPVVSKSRHVASAILTTSEWDYLAAQGERVWLFRPQPRSLKHAAVCRYLRLHSENGGCRRDRYKIQNRSPWYSTPMPVDVDGFITGMSGRGAWICFNETRTVNATNTLYVVSFRQTILRREQYAWGLSLLTGLVQKQIRRVTRRYADGLAKLEPGALADLQLPCPPRIPNAVSLYKSAVTRLLDGDGRGASALAEEAIFNNKAMHTGGKKFI